jgi:DNA-binding transcriptional ArsR family regulator
MTLAADQYLATLGLSRPHHRILYVVARHPDISIGALIEVLGISKQAVNRPLGLLLQRKLLTSKRSPEQHRSKLLRLVGQRGVSRRAQSADRTPVCWPGRPSFRLTTHSLRCSCSSPHATSASSPITFRS